MAIHSSVLAWKNPRTEEPRGLILGHDLVTEQQHKLILKDTTTA